MRGWNDLENLELITEATNNLFNDLGNDFLFNASRRSWEVVLLDGQPSFNAPLHGSRITLQHPLLICDLQEVFESLELLRRHRLGQNICWLIMGADELQKNLLL